MKRLTFLFLALFGCFLFIWLYKIKTPVNRPDEYAEGTMEDSGNWWNIGSITVDDDWRLDPEIPLNYKPVPGENELYMVVDNNGNIIGYRKRTKQIDGSWLWSDVNPDIPDNYEPVEGLEDVYKVTSDSGEISYYHYIRNDDDTFAFVPVDENGEAIDVNRDATTIDGSHVHITGNIYSRLNEHGVIIAYDKRIENSDGSFTWIETEQPNLDDVLGWDVSAGDGQDLQGIENDTVGSLSELPPINVGGDSYNVDINITGGSSGTVHNDGTVSAGPTIVNNTDGTHTEIEIIRETKNIDGYTSVYETTVQRTYDDAGNLISTQSSDPVEVSNTKNITQETEPPQANKSNRQDTIEKEAARVTGSYTYNNDIENSVFTLLNAQRSSNNLKTLKKSDTATMIARLRAADMAAYDTADEDLPTYGSLGSMLSDYKISASCPGENIWKSVLRSADDIHTRFQTIDSSRNTRMNEYVTQYGIAVAEKNGYYYICEVFF